MYKFIISIRPTSKLCVLSKIIFASGSRLTRVKITLTPGFQDEEKYLVIENCQRGIVKHASNKSLASWKFYFECALQMVDIFVKAHQVMPEQKYFCFRLEDFYLTSGIKLKLNLSG